MTTVILTAEHDGTTDVNLAHETEASTLFDSGTGNQIADANTSTSTEYRAGLRFTGTSSIPALANTVYNAALEVSVTSSGGKSPTNYDDPYVYVYVEEDTDVPDYSTDADVTSRTPKTSSYVWWNETNIGTGYNTMPVSIQDDLAAAIQEVIDDTAWASGNAINLLTVPIGTSLRYFRWLRSTSLPKLHISFHPEVDADDKVYVYSAGDSFNLAQGSGYRNIPAAGRPAGAGGQLVMVFWGEKDASTSYLFSPQSGVGWTSVAGHLFASNTGYGGAAVAEDDGTDYWTNAFYSAVTIGGQTCKVFRVHNADLSDLGLIQDFDTENETTGTNILYTANANHTSPKHSLQFALAGHANTSSGMTPPTGYTERMDEAPSPGSNYGRVAAYTRETTTFTAPMSPAPATHASGAASGAAQGITFVIPSGTSTGTLLGRGGGLIVGRATTVAATPTPTLGGEGRAAVTGTAAATKTAAPTAQGAGLLVGRGVTALGYTALGTAGSVLVGRATTVATRSTAGVGVAVVLSERAFTSPAAIIPTTGEGATVTAGRAQVSTARSGVAAGGLLLAGRAVTTSWVQTPTQGRSEALTVGRVVLVPGRGRPSKVGGLIIGRAVTTASRSVSGRAAGLITTARSVTLQGVYTWGRAIGSLVTGIAPAVSDTLVPSKLGAIVVGRAVTSTQRPAVASRAGGVTAGTATAPAPTKAGSGLAGGIAYGTASTAEGTEHPGRGGGVVVGRVTTSCTRTVRARGGPVVVARTPSTPMRGAVAAGGLMVTGRSPVTSTARTTAAASVSVLAAPRVVTSQGVLGAADAHPVLVEYRESVGVLVKDPSAAVTVVETVGVVYREND